MGAQLAKTPEEHIQGEIKANRLIAPIGQALERHYPGWVWDIEHIWGTGVITIKNLSLVGDYAMVLHARNIETNDNVHLAVVAGGEMLERCGFPRGPRPVGAMIGVEKDCRGDVKRMDTEILDKGSL